MFVFDKMFLLEKEKERFWSKVFISGPDDCWEWQASKHPFGYGRFQLNSKPTFAHRISYHLTYGIKDFSHIIHHKCNNPSCVNPDHLLEGTQSDNIQACADQNRLIGNRKLTEKDVYFIRWMLKYKNKYGLIKELAERYNLNRQAIKDIKIGRSWKHVEVK